MLLYKSQDTFERQLSYISAGALALSMGYMKDIIHDFANARLKWCLVLGWIFLGTTLIVNCISHIKAAGFHNITIDEINKGKYDDNKVAARYKRISKINWLTVATLVLGILIIIIFVAINIL